MSTEVQSFIDTFPLDQFPGVNTIGLGWKEKSGSVIYRESIIFGVSEKKPVSDIPEGEVLPDIIVIDDKQIETDVVEDNIDWEFEECPHIGSELKDDHKMKTRPLKGGVSLGNMNHPTKVGTLGAVVVDAIDGQVVGLSNNHVLVPNIYTTALRQEVSYNYKDEDILQPAIESSALLPGSSYDPITNVCENCVGKVKRVYPMNNSPYFWDANEIDAGIFTIKGDIQVTGEQVNLTLEDGSDIAIPMVPLASKEEIDTLLVNNIPLFKSSRTSGPIGTTQHPTASGSDTVCFLQASKMNYTPRINSRQFKNVIKYWDPSEDNKIDPSQAGDSGSLICGSFDGEWKAVGLHIAGGRSGGIDYGVMCRMDRIKDLLKIDSYFPGTVPVDMTPEYRVLEEYRDDVFIEIDGQTYWQVGRTTDDVNTAFSETNSRFETLPE